MRLFFDTSVPIVSKQLLESGAKLNKLLSKTYTDM